MGIVDRIARIYGYKPTEVLSMPPEEVIELLQPTALADIDAEIDKLCFMSAGGGEGLGRQIRQLQSLRKDLGPEPLTPQEEWGKGSGDFYEEVKEQLIGAK